MMLKPVCKLWIAAFIMITASAGFCEKQEIDFETRSPLNEPPTIRKAREACAQLSPDKPEARRLSELGKAIQDISAPRDRAMFLTAFILGNMLTGNQQAAAAARSYLSQRAPNSPYTATLSFENISEICSYCDGTGSTGEPCQRCSGTGKCSLCQGSGKSTVTGEERPCSVCGGNGNCRECAGTGEIQAECRHCSGRGRQVSKDKTMILYSEILAQNRSILELSAKTAQALDKQDAAAASSLRREITSEKTRAARKDAPHFKAYIKMLEHMEEALGPEAQDEEPDINNDYKQ